MAMPADVEVFFCFFWTGFGAEMDICPTPQSAGGNWARIFFFTAQPTSVVGFSNGVRSGADV